MAAAHYTIAVRYYGSYWHEGRGWAVVFSFDHDPDVIHVAFAD